MPLRDLQTAADLFQLGGVLRRHVVADLHARIEGEESAGRFLCIVEYVELVVGDDQLIVDVIIEHISVAVNGHLHIRPARIDHIRHVIEFFGRRPVPIGIVQLALCAADAFLRIRYIGVHVEEDGIFFAGDLNAELRICVRSKRRGIGHRDLRFHIECELSTRSYICVKQDDGSYKGVYCHWDGYLTYNGAMLIDHYNSLEKANEILALGDISSLKENLYPDPAKGPHSFDYGKQQEGVTIAYGRDRGETGTEAKTVDLKTLQSDDSWIDYIYVFEDGRWKYFEYGQLSEGLKDVDED